MPGQWPPRDLFEEDIQGRPLLSPFAAGSGVDAFLKLIDTPSSYSGQTGLFPQVNATEDGLVFASAGGFTPDNTFFVESTGGVTSFDDVAYTSVQTAIDAAVALTPTSTDQYLVVVLPGRYDEGNIDMAQYVHVQGWNGGGTAELSGSASVILVGGTPATGTANINSAADSSIANITFADNGSTGQTHGLHVQHDDFVMRDVVHYSAGSWIERQLEAGQYFNCTFINGTLNMAGNSTTMPRLFNCYGITVSNTNGFELQSSSATAYGLWDGGSIKQFDTTSSGHYFIDVTSPNVTIVGLYIDQRGSGGGNEDRIQFDGRAIGCKFDLAQAGLASSIDAWIETAGGAVFSGCDFHFRGTEGNTGTVGCIQIEDLSGGDVIFSGCTFTKADGLGNSLFMLGSGITGDTYGIKLSGNTFNYNETSTGFNGWMAVHTSGFSGDVRIELAGNLYHMQQASIPSNTGAGRLWFTGSDVKSVFYPVSTIGATATALNEHFPAAELDVAAEVAYVTGRNPVPGGLLLDASLLLSAINSDGIQIDAMTDADATNLSAHTPTGGTGTWTATAGTMTIQSNACSCSASGVNIYTYSIAGSNGFLRGNATAASASNTNSIGLLFRYADASNYWRLVDVDDSPRFRLIKRVAGVETTVWDDTTETQHMAVAFNGDRIRIYEDYDGTPRLVAEIEDSDLAGNTTVGIYCQRISGTHTIDDWEWHPGGDVDITVDTQYARDMQPWPAETASDDNGVDVMHKAYTRHDVDIGIHEDLWNVEVTLDVLNGNITDLYVHGLVARFLPIFSQSGEGAIDDLTPAQGVIYR